MTDTVLPVHVFCGERHYGPMCPNGLTTCCLCFDSFPLEALTNTPEGGKWDVCLTCAEHEAVAIAMCFMASYPLRSLAKVQTTEEPR